MLEHLVACLLQWQKPLLPITADQNPVTANLLTQVKGASALAPQWPLRVNRLALLPARASDAEPFRPFGYQFRLTTLKLPAVMLSSGSGQLFAAAEVALNDQSVTLNFLGLDLAAMPQDASSSGLLEVSHSFMVNPTTIGLWIEAQDIVRGQQMPYQPQPGDRVKDNWVKRDGEFLGYLIDGDESIIRTVDQKIGEPLDTDWAGQSKNYRIVSASDPHYSDGVEPESVFRKSKPMTMLNMGGGKRDWLRRHVLYLKVDQPLIEGETYQVEFQDSAMPAVSFTYDPLALRSEAVQVSHVGFAPEDPVKVAFLSTWLGDGGPLAYDENLAFYVVDDATSEVVYEGTIELSKRVGEVEDYRDRDYAGTNVYWMDFSDLTTPGRYRVAVEGVGSSFPFEVKPNVWESAFYVSARGLLHQRSGIELGPPYTDYKRPRPFHPEDGVKVYQSTVPLMDTSGGLNSEAKVFDVLQETRTEDLVPEAWGGWFDAGDWDRRIHHLEVTRLLLELAALHPDYFSRVDLNLPESDNALPDIIDEALWGLDVFKRMQLPNGAIRGGIESAAHPNLFEGSWQESLTVMAYGPGVWSSYFYAGGAAQAAYVLKDLDPDRAASYRSSAEKAMEWAEAARQDGQGQEYEKVANQRNLAAAELYRLTGEDRWHQLFLSTTVFTDPEANPVKHKEYDHKDAAFVYATTQRPDINEVVQKNAQAALLKMAKQQQDVIENTAFRWYKHPYAPMGWGNALGSLKTTDLLRAHALSGDDTYLQSAILASQFALGANPDNTVYTTGLGHRYPRDPLIVDLRANWQQPPPGITIYGPLDIVWRSNFWFVDLVKNDTYPEPVDWPTVETFFDVYSYVPVSEFTVMQTIGPTAYGLGYLAAEQPRPQGD